MARRSARSRRTGRGGVLGGRRLGLRVRLASALLVTVVVTLGLSLYSVQRLSGLADRAEDVYVTGTVPVDALRSLQVTWWQFQTHVARGEAAEPGSDEQTREQYATDRAAALLVGQADVVEAAGLARGARQPFQDYLEAANAYVEVQRQVGQSAGPAAQGQTPSLDIEGQRLSAAATFALTQATTRQLSAAGATAAAAMQDYRSARRTTSLLVLTCLALALATSTMVIRSVMRPLSQVRDSLARLATEGDPSTGLPSQEGDLLADLARDLQVVHRVHADGELFRRTVETFPVAVLRLDGCGTTTYANAEAQRLLGLTAGATADEQLRRLNPETRAGYLHALTAATRDTTRPPRIEIQLDGTRTVALPRHDAEDVKRRCSVAFVPLGDITGSGGAVACFTDITDTVSLHAELISRAERDALTGLANRETLLASLHSLLASDCTTTTVAFMDLDLFKPVNDRLGHAAGDELLIHVATQLRRAMRPTEVVGRLGGDEFLVVTNDMEDDGAAALLADRMRRAVEGAFSVAGERVQVSVSIGVSRARPGDTAADLVARADANMYQDKRSKAAPARRRTTPPRLTHAGRATTPE